MIESTTPTPPVARKHHTETQMHGVVLADDYAWLRDKENPDVTAYLDAENAYADAVMEPLAGLREELYQEMLSHVKQTDVWLNITTQWSGTVALDQKGDPLMNAIIWMDSRGASYAQKLMHGPIRIDGYGIGKALKWVRYTGGGPSPSGKDSIFRTSSISKTNCPKYTRRPINFLSRKII